MRRYHVWKHLTPDGVSFQLGNEHLTRPQSQYYGSIAANSYEEALLNMRKALTNGLATIILPENGS